MEVKLPRFNTNGGMSYRLIFTEELAFKFEK